MKKFILILILLPIFAIAQIPQTMSYQGRLEDNSGNPVTDGSYSLIFTIFDAATNGNSLWTETRTVTTEDGFFNLTLGENTAINISTDQQIWLNVNIGGNDLTPRTKLASSLSSLSTKSIENTASAGNSVVSSINASTGGIDASKLANGNITNAKFQFLDGVTSDIQTQLNSKQATLPAQSGNSGKFLSTDGTNLSWEDASVADLIELSLSADITITDTAFVNITSTQPTLAADAVYLIKGMLVAGQLGSSSYIDIKINYSGTTGLILFEVKDKNSDTAGLLKKTKMINSSAEYIIDGIIKTTTSGSLSIKAAKNTIGDDSSKITTGTKIFLIRIK